MSAVSAVAGPSYLSGWCTVASGQHGRCKGAYGGTTCGCSCHLADAGPATAADQVAPVATGATVAGATRPEAEAPAA